MIIISNNDLNSNCNDGGGDGAAAAAVAVRYILKISKVPRSKVYRIPAQPSTLASFHQYTR